jgi:integral membrane protein (TIGR01906 family)
VFNYWKVSNLLLVILVVLWSFSTAIIILLHLPGLYLITIKALNINVHLSLVKINDNFDYITEYLQSPFITKMHNLIAVDYNGRQHFQDVKHFILINDVSMVVLTIFVSQKILQLKQIGCLWMIMNEIKLVYSSLLVIFIFGLLDFNDLFFIFHKLLFFYNSNWIFSEKTNPIINVFPEEYFMLCFIFIYLSITLVLGCLFYFGKRDLTQPK